MVYKVFFSPTGGTKKVLDILSPSGTEIDLSLKLFNRKICLSSSDIIYLALPVFGGRAPQMMIKRFRENIRSDGARAVLIAVYGNRAFEDALIELYDEAERNGFKVIAAVAAIAEHSMLREIAEGRPDEKDRMALTAFRERISKRIDEGKKIESIPGSRPYKKNSTFLTPITTADCIRCGRCYNLCPASAIDELMPNKTDSEKCIGCARCISVCPQRARKYDGPAYEELKKRLRALCIERKENELFL